MKLVESKPNDEHNLAPYLKCCPHTPLTDGEKWLKPQDCWCDFHQCACCRICFDSAHKNCKDRAGTSMTRKINKDRLVATRPKKS